MAFIYDFTDTWNNAATVFNGIKLNVTNTASHADSALLDLQIGGSSMLKLNKTGILTVGGAMAINASNWLFLGGSNSTYEQTLAIRNGQMNLPANMQVYWSSTNGPADNTNGGAFGILDGANIYSLGRVAALTSAKVNAYNAFTDASNYERAILGWSSNVLTIGTEAAGTGTRRNVKLDGANRAAYDAAPSTTVIRDILISHGLMAAS